MTNKDKVLQFLRQLCDYVQGDLETFHEIIPNTKGQRGCGVGEVLTCFSVMDIFGYLYNPANRSHEKQSRENTENLRYALTNKNLFSDILQNVSHADVVIHLFRHALAHHYLPRQIGLIKPPVPGSGSSLFCKIFKTGGQYFLDLNVDFLNRKTRESIDTILKNLANTSDGIFFDVKYERVEELRTQAKSIFINSKLSNTGITYLDIEAGAEDLTNLFAVKQLGPPYGTQIIDYPFQS